MTVTLDPGRGKEAAQLLYTAFSTTGIHGRMDMPEDQPPQGVAAGSLEHILFITLTVSIDYQRDADALWASSRRTYADPETRYLFHPQSLHEVPFSKVIQDMQKYGLSKKQRNDAYIWKTVAVSFYKKWQGDPRNFLAGCNWSAPSILKHLKTDTHVENNRPTWDFPFLRGNKIGPLWLRMLRDNVHITILQDLHLVPIPVDIHVARATLALGLVRGQFDGSLDTLFEDIRKVWFQSVITLQVHNRPMISLDVDEPLWHLSKYGCTYRDKETGQCPMYFRCEMKELCTQGKVWIDNGKVILET